MKGFLNKLGGTAGNLGGPRLALAAFGKHPGWPDFMPGIGVDTELLVGIEQTLYRGGIRGQISSGAWEKLDAEKRQDGFDHVFAWFQNGQMVLGLLWSSKDQAGRAKYPMALCIDGGAMPAKFMLAELLPGMTALRQACKSATTVEQVTELCRSAQEQLRGKGAAESEKAPEPPPLSDRRRFLEHPDFGPDKIGLLRLTHELSGQFDLSGGDQASAPASRSLHLRVPLAAAPPETALLVWPAFLRAAVGAAPSIVLLYRDGAAWLDVIVGPPQADDFFCLQAGVKALPLVTQIPFELTGESRQLLPKIEARFLGQVQPQSQSLSPPAAPASPKLSPSVPPPASPVDGGTPKSSKSQFIAIGGAIGALVLAGGLYLAIHAVHQKETAVAGLREKERLLADRKAAAERAEADRVKQAQLLAERQAAEARARAEKEAADKAEADRVKQARLLAEQQAAEAREKAEKEAAAKAEAERVKQAQLAAEQKAAEDGKEYANFIALARKALASRDFSNAQAAVNKAGGIKPGSAEAAEVNNQIKSALQSATDTAQAEANYSASISRGTAALQQSNYTAAISDFIDALKYKKDDADALAKLNESQLRAKQASEAAAAAQQAASNAPPNLTAAADAGAKGGAAPPLGQVYTNSIGMEFVWFPNVSGGLYVARYEVTQKAYKQIMGGALPDGQPGGTDDELPVQNVSWDKAGQFCRALTQRDHHQYNLPTTAQWLSFAGLAPEDEPKAYGFLTNGTFAHQITSWQSYRTGPEKVGKLGPESNGLCDVFGNVREWTDERSRAGFSYRTQGGKTKSLILPAKETVPWIDEETGIRCVLQPDK